MRIRFLGATGTVTGSRYLVETARGRLLVDCGLFQGLKQLRLRNWKPLPFEPASLDAVVLTHAHLDHSGYLPLLVREGFRGPIYCTGPTRDLCAVLLPDSGYLQEEEAAAANRYGYSKHRPALPLYTYDDAVRSLDQFETIDFETDIAPVPGVTLRLLRAGHMLGAAMAHLAGDGTDILFSGDLGRPHDPLLPPPAAPPPASHLVVESTYGDREHDPTDPLDQLAEIIGRTAARGGAVVIPSFAVGRAQLLLYYLHILLEEKRIPKVPVFLDSPMAGQATTVYRLHADETVLRADLCDAICDVATIIETVEQSKEIDQMKIPRIIISASGMATGGRVVHHLKALAPNPRNTILFSGHQAIGTRGASIVGGAKAVKIHGGYVPIRAEVAALDNISAHADSREILAWLRLFPSPPRRAFITHGEPVASDALRLRIEEELRWNAVVPEFGETVEL